MRLKLAAALLTLGATDSTIRYVEDVRASRPEPPREAKPQLAAALEALRAGRLPEARAALERLLRLIETTAPYQASLAQVDWIEGPLAGRPVLEFSPQSLITMRGITPAAGANAGVRFIDVIERRHRFEVSTSIGHMGFTPTRACCFFLAGSSSAR